MSFEWAKHITAQPSLHAPYLYSQLSASGAITFRWFGAELPTSYAEYLTHIETLFHKPPTSCAFVIYDKSYSKENDGKGRIAGSIAYLNANPTHKSIEIGFVCILPEFQVCSLYLSFLYTSIGGVWIDDLVTESYLNSEPM